VTAGAPDEGWASVATLYAEGEQEPEPGQPARRIHPAVEAVLLAGLAVLIAFMLKTLVAQAFFIPSGSMRSQLVEGDRVLVSKISYVLHEPRRGDIVVFDSPAEEDTGGGALPVRFIRGIFEAMGLARPAEEEFIKRVIALPGETVDIRDGRVFVDGRELVEPYLDEGTVTTPSGVPLPVTVPDDHLWVMGDSRANSSDSRAFGPIDEESIVGRAILVVWPPGRAKFI